MSCRLRTSLASGTFGLEVRHEVTDIRGERRRAGQPVTVPPSQRLRTLV